MIRTPRIHTPRPPPQTKQMSYDRVIAAMQEVSETSFAMTEKGDETAKSESYLYLSGNESDSHHSTETNDLSVIERDIILEHARKSQKISSLPRYNSPISQSTPMVKMEDISDDSEDDSHAIFETEKPKNLREKMIQEAYTPLRKRSVSPKTTPPTSQGGSFVSSPSFKAADEVTSLRQQLSQQKSELEELRQFKSAVSNVEGCQLLQSGKNLELVEKTHLENIYAERDSLKKQLSNFQQKESKVAKDVSQFIQSYRSIKALHDRLLSDYLDKIGDVSLKKGQSDFPSSQRHLYAQLKLSKVDDITLVESQNLLKDVLIQLEVAVDELPDRLLRIKNGSLVYEHFVKRIHKSVYGEPCVQDFADDPENYKACLTMMASTIAAMARFANEVS